MRKLTLTSLALTINLFAFSQVTIIKNVDDMTDKTTYLPSERFMAANETLTVGCALDMVIDEKDGVLSSEMIAVKIVGLGLCNENNTIIVLFDNGEKFSIKSWNKFNCKGNAYFTLSNENIEMLKANSISKVRITNGKSFKSYTSIIKDKNYFIEFYESLNK